MTDEWFHLCVVSCFNLQLYDVNSSGDPEESIYGIMFEKFTVSPKSDRKYFIMVSTLRYMYKVSLKVTTIYNNVRISSGMR